MLTLALFALLQAAEPQPAVTIADQTKIYDYEFAWSQEAAAIPALDDLLRKRAGESRAEIVGDATTAETDSKKGVGWFPDNGYVLKWHYATAGKSTPLLSLAGDWYTYTGGAHGVFAATALLWDKLVGREMEPAELFDRVTEFARLRPVMCTALNAERKLRRKGDGKLNTSFDSLDEAFNGCPALNELTIWISDRDGDNRFDTFNFSAAPYTAGPYVEGQYDVAVPVSARIIAALKPAYRESFEAQPQ